MSDDFSHYGGIGFSGAREPLSNLWCALGIEEDERLVIRALRPYAFRADLGAFVAAGWRETVAAGPAARTLWGVDFPIGLPVAAVPHLDAGIGSWSQLIAWVADRPAGEVRETVSDELRAARATDARGAPGPLDQRLYKQTVEGMRWLHDLRETTEVSVIPQEDAGEACAIIEVRPADTARELGLPRRRAPSRPGETRARAAALRTFLDFADPGQEAVAVTIEDAWDATLACLTAWLARSDLAQPYRTTDLPRDVIGLEGWIYRPPATIEG